MQRAQRVLWKHGMTGHPDECSLCGPVWKCGSGHDRASPAPSMLPSLNTRIWRTQSGPPAGNFGHVAGIMRIIENGCFMPKQGRPELTKRAERRPPANGSGYDRDTRRPEPGRAIGCSGRLGPNRCDIAPRTRAAVGASPRAAIATKESPLPLRKADDVPPLYVLEYPEQGPARRGRYGHGTRLRDPDGGVAQARG